MYKKKCANCRMVFRSSTLAHSAHCIATSVTFAQCIGWEMQSIGEDQRHTSWYNKCFSWDMGDNIHYHFTFLSQGRLSLAFFLWQHKKLYYINPLAQYCKLWQQSHTMSSVFNFVLECDFSNSSSKGFPSVDTWNPT